MINQDSLSHLQISLARIDELIRAAVARAQAAGHDPTDALRGLVIGDDEIQGHLNRSPMSGLWADDNQYSLSLTEADTDLPFLQLTRAFDLSLVDSYILLLSLAPELDRRYERLYAFLQDDVSQRRPTVNLLMNILGTDTVERFAVWERLGPNSPLRTHHLIECSADAGRSDAVFLANYIKVDNRVVSYLLGDLQTDARLKNAVEINPVMVGLASTERLLTALAPLDGEHAPIVYLHGVEGAGQQEAAAAFCAQFQLPLMRVDMAALAALEMPIEQLWSLTLREARLLNTGILIDKWESCLDERGEALLLFWNALLEYPGPVFLCGKIDWEPLNPQRSRRLIRLSFELPPYPERRQAWEQALCAQQVEMSPKHIDELAHRFRFSYSHIVRAVNTAIDLAHSRGEAVTSADLFTSAQSHSSLQLGRLARRVLPRYDWEDLILPPDQFSQLYEMAARAEHQHKVHVEWGFGKKVAPVPGVSALFAGESGTGKTLAAEVIAKNLGLILYKVDLSSVVSKYIGETEKNLGSIFEEAQASNAILFFDEADALFGKRSEVKDARDRYANIEVAYLLQLIENYDGVAVLATNLRQNLDEAFTRRLDFLIDFPFPDSEYRKHIWTAHFPPQAPLGPDVDLGDVANRYRLAGGNIRNAALASAYLAAADGGVITMAHIRNAVRREHQKMGRLLDDSF
ncbi:MAG: ATP-binding protein [Burkholderiales bacterium]|nr:ATP-binding protein [Anaerolineae bacterium]